MSVRSSLVALCLAVGAPVAAAQVVSSGPLQQVDPWGVGWLGQADGALGADTWRNTNATALKPLMESINPAQLSPAAQQGLRQLVMSAGHSPEGGDALIPDRLRLLEALGETSRADDLRGRFPDTEWGQGGEQRAAAFALLDGRARSQCARVADMPAGDEAWMPVRALCYAIAEDYDAAALLGEQASQSNPDLASWMLAAIEYKREPSGRAPQARYGTPFETAVTLATSLPPDFDALSAVPADTATLIMRHPTASLQEKRTVLSSAVAGGRASAEDVIALLMPTEDDDAPGQGSIQAALVAASNPEASPAEKASAYAAALATAERPALFRLAALALSEALGDLAPGAENAEHAALFTRAALTAEESDLAARWRTALPTGEGADGWEAGRIDVALVLSGAPPSDLNAAITNFLEASPLAEDAERPSGRSARADFDARLVETSRALFLLTGTGRGLPPQARALLSDLRTSGNGISDPALMRAQAANNVDAPGEAALAALALVSADPSTQSYIGLADALTQLRSAGLQAAADAIALEAMQLHKTF